MILKAQQFKKNILILLQINRKVQKKLKTEKKKQKRKAKDRKEEAEDREGEGATPPYKAAIVL